MAHPGCLRTPRRFAHSSRGHIQSRLREVGPSRVGRHRWQRRRSSRPRRHERRSRGAGTPWTRKVFARYRLGSRDRRERRDPLLGGRGRALLDELVGESVPPVFPRDDERLSSGGEAAEHESPLVQAIDLLDREVPPAAIPLCEPNQGVCRDVRAIKPEYRRKGAAGVDITWVNLRPDASTHLVPRLLGR